jgi:outer membrane protein assembly factor BamB
MRPLVSGTEAFVRRLKKTGPALAAIQLADGVVRWETRPRPDHWIVSDPVQVSTAVHACTATKSEAAVKGEFVYTLKLATFDAATGEVLRERPLATLRDQWWPQRDCQLIAVEDAIVVTCAGGVIGCDLSGNVRWLRRDTWVPTAVDSFWALQAHGPPAVDDGRLFVVQPGVPAVTAIDVADGRMLWSCGLPGARRVLGCVNGVVVVEGSRGLDAFAAADGRRTWRLASTDLLDACLVGPADSGAALVLATVREADGNPALKQPSFVPTLVWLDAVTGKAGARTALVALRDPQPCMGPLVPHGGRLWAVFGRGMADATRDIVELVPR